MMDYRKIITIEPGKRSGKPCIRGLRMTVSDVLEYLASGMTVGEILVDFPDLHGRRYSSLPGLRRRTRAAIGLRPGRMKLLFDQNFSHRLATMLLSEYPESEHVRDMGLSEADDLVIWRYAADQGFTIVSKDSDFQQRAMPEGHPPKVVWLRLGNCATSAVLVALRDRQANVIAFSVDPTTSYLVLS